MADILLPGVYRCTVARSAPSTHVPYASRRQSRRCLQRHISGCPEEDHDIGILFPSVPATCRILSRAMKVPLLPTPALQCTTMGRCSGLTRSLKARTNLRTSCSESLTGKEVLPDECLRRLRDPEVWPGGEVEVPDSSHLGWAAWSDTVVWPSSTHRVPAHHSELIDVPVREVRLVQNCHLNAYCQAVSPLAESATCMSP